MSIEPGDSSGSIHEIALGLALSRMIIGGRALFGRGAPLGLPNSDKLRMPINLTWESEHR